MSLLAAYEKNLASQSGEDGVIEHILGRIGEGGRVAAEFGAADGKWFSNTWALEQRGWKRYLFDGDSRGNSAVHQSLLTMENINGVFDDAGVPKVVDVLSIDVDGNDFWLWLSLMRRARVVIVEYNAHLPQDDLLVMKYNPSHTWDGTNYFGASLRAYTALGACKGLRLVHYTTLNGIFVDAVEAEAAGLRAVEPAHSCQQIHPIRKGLCEWVRVEVSQLPQAARSQTSSEA